MENMLIFLCHDQHILAHGPQLPPHGSFYRIALNLINGGMLLSILFILFWKIYDIF